MSQKIQSLCIPRVYKNISEQRIRNILTDLKLGEIHHIDLVSRKSEKGEEYNRAFIHFKKWYNNSNADKASELLLNGKEIKVIYSDPWFWKISLYRKPNSTKPQIKTN
jgi:hypothetical protein